MTLDEPPAVLIASPCWRCDDAPPARLPERIALAASIAKEGEARLTSLGARAERINSIDQLHRAAQSHGSIALVAHCAAPRFKAEQINNATEAIQVLRNLPPKYRRCLRPAIGWSSRITRANEAQRKERLAEALNVIVHRVRSAAQDGQCPPPIGRPLLENLLGDSVKPQPQIELGEKCVTVEALLRSLPRQKPLVLDLLLCHSLGVQEAVRRMAAAFGGDRTWRLLGAADVLEMSDAFRLVERAIELMHARRVDYFHARIMTQNVMRDEYSRIGT